MASKHILKLKRTFAIGHDYSEKPAGLAWRSNTFFIVATVAVGLFTDLFLYGLVVPILPYMLQDRVGLPDDQIQSHVSGMLAAYAGASVLFSPIAGYVADKTSTRQAPFLLGLTALLAATVLLFLGANVPTLVVARILQGISAAFVWTIGLALCLETVGPENLGKKFVDFQFHLRREFAGSATRWGFVFEDRVCRSVWARICNISHRFHHARPRHRKEGRQAL